MDKKLEARIARLEKLLSNKSVKNEDIAHDEYEKAVDLINKATVAAVSSLGLIMSKRKVRGQGMVNVHEYDPEVVAEYKQIVDDLVDVRNRVNSLNVEFSDAY